jgi:tryptophan 2,3-dioxygenase
MERELDTIIQPNESTLTYDRYLQIPNLLSLQNPKSQPAHHDETLFIIIHQVYELWFKQILHEIDGAERAIVQDDALRLMRSFKRITTIQDVLIQQVDVLETMTPSDFNVFRENLNPASGFQSHQFRLFEFRLGLKDETYLKFFRTQPEAIAKFEQALTAPSLYDLVLRFMKRAGYKIPDAVLSRNVRLPHELNEQVVDEMLAIYKNPAAHMQLYVLLEALLDVDEKIELWRYRHVAMVKRMIGTRSGTGGSSGAKYLSSTLTKRCFPEIWEVRNRFSHDASGKGSY